MYAIRSYYELSQAEARGVRVLGRVVWIGRENP